VVHRLEPQSGHPGVEDRFRNWLSRSIGELYGTRAGLVDALITGRRGEIEPALNAAFARSGLVHLLSISGFHVGVMFGWTVLLLRAGGISRERRAPIAALVALGYVGFLGFPAPASRAALLACLGAWAMHRQRRVAPLPLLAVTCLLTTLLDPGAIFDLGGWLSASAFFGMLVFTRWSDRAIGPVAASRMFFASLGATLATAPFSAAAFGSVALAGIGLNFAAIPLAALAIPMVFLSVIAAPLAPLARTLAAGGGLGLTGLEQLARTGSGIPFGAVTTLPGIRAAIPWVLLFLFVLWALGRRNTSRRAALRIGWGVGLAAIGLLLPLGRLGSSYDGKGLTLHFLNVGQGDAALIRTPQNRWILVDGGPADHRHDAGREVIVPFLVRHGVRRLAAVVVSHAHLDHVGGIPSVLEAIPADLILEPAQPVSEPRYLRMLALADEKGIRWRAGRAGDSIVVDGVTLRVLHPDTTWNHWREDLNDDSVVLQVRSGAFDAILAGDLGVRAEARLAGRIGRIDLLKVGHHGSASSTGAAWLDELKPRAAVISVGRNRYGHPSPDAMARLTQQGAEIWRTDRESSVTVTVADSTMTLRGRTRTGRYVLLP
jgi:competence protein ComEC